MFDWTGTSESSPSVGSTGESFVSVTGGGALRSGSLFGILRMEESAFGDLCRGVIGSGQRICLRSECNIASHSVKKVSWAQLVGDDSHCIFIQGSSGAEGEAATSVFGSPVLPGSCVRDSEWAELETSPRSLESWQATFASLKDAMQNSGSDQVDEKTVADLLETTKHDVKFVFTPARKKHRGKDIATSTPSQDYDQKPAAKKPIPKPIPFFKVPVELGSQPDKAIRTLIQGAWRDLVTNVSTLKATIEIERSKSPTENVGADAYLDEIELKTSVLRELLGDRPADFGTASAFGLLSQVVESLRDLEASMNVYKVRVDSLSVGSISTALEQRIQVLEDQARSFESLMQKAIKEQLDIHFTRGDFRTQFIEPTLKLLSRSSRVSTDPGGKWEDELTGLASRVSTLESAQSNQPSTASVNFLNHGSSNNSSGLFQWNAQAPLSSTPTTTTGSVVGDLRQEMLALKEEVARLKADVKDLQDQAESDAIVIGSIVFSSKKFCQSWLVLHGAEGDPHVFVDPVSMLSISTSDATQDEERAANQRATTAKVKDKSPYHTAYIASFSLELPPLLGKGGDSSLTTNSRALAGVPRFVDFHPPSGREGIQQRILDYIKDGKKTLEESIGDLFAFGSEPASVARELLLLSKTFWDELCHWMIRYHREIKEESDATEHEVWILISHCVRAVFKSLRDARAPGRASSTPGGMLWGTLRAHQVMKDYRGHDFSGHPKIALILHEHLIRFSTPRSKFDELQLQFDEKLEKVQRSVNQAVAAVNKKGSNNKSTGESKKQQG